MVAAIEIATINERSAVDAIEQDNSDRHDLFTLGQGKRIIWFTTHYRRSAWWVLRWPYGLSLGERKRGQVGGWDVFGQMGRTLYWSRIFAHWPRYYWMRATFPSSWLEKPGLDNKSSAAISTWCDRQRCRQPRNVHSNSWSPRAICTVLGQPQLQRWSMVFFHLWQPTQPYFVSSIFQQESFRDWKWSHRGKTRASISARKRSSNALGAWLKPRTSCPNDGDFRTYFAGLYWKWAP